jgi:hypothetical protein
MLQNNYSNNLMSMKDLEIIINLKSVIAAILYIKIVEVRR